MESCFYFFCCFAFPFFFLRNIAELHLKYPTTHRSQQRLHILIALHALHAFLARSLLFALDTTLTTSSFIGTDRSVLTFFCLFCFFFFRVYTALCMIYSNKLVIFSHHDMFAFLTIFHEIYDRNVNIQYAYAKPFPCVSSRYPQTEKISEVK